METMDFIINTAEELVEIGNKETKIRKKRSEKTEIKMNPYDPEPLKKDFGEHCIIKADTLEDVSFLSTGSLILDYGLGGGFPKGRFSIITGSKHTGKSFISYKTIQEYQKVDSRPAVLIDYEKSFIKSWAVKIGVDLSRLLICQPVTINEAMEVVKLYVKNHLSGLIIIDSIASGATKEEMQRTAFDDERAIGAKAWNKFFRAGQGSLNSKTDEGFTSDAAIILINQDRIGFAQGFSYKTQPGGGGKDFASSMTVSLQKSCYIIKSDSNIFIEGKPDDMTLLSGIESKYIIDKCKTAPALGREGVFRIIFNDENFAGSYDTIFEIWYLAKLFKLIKVSGAWIEYEGEKINGQKAFQLKLMEDTVMRQGLIQKIKDITLKLNG